MATVTRFYQGGFNPQAPQGNRSEQWSNGTQTGDPAAGYTSWDQAGTVTLTRALTGQESSDLAAQDVQFTSQTNQATLQQQARTALTNNRTYIALASPTTAQVTAQVKALTQQMNAVIRMCLQQFDGTN